MRQILSKHLLYICCTPTEPTIPLLPLPPSLTLSYVRPHRHNSPTVVHCPHGSAQSIGILSFPSPRLSDSAIQLLTAIPALLEFPSRLMCHTRPHWSHFVSFRPTSYCLYQFFFDPVRELTSASVILVSNQQPNQVILALSLLPYLSGFFLFSILPESPLFSLGSRAQNLGRRCIMEMKLGRDPGDQRRNKPVSIYLGVCFHSNSCM